MDYQPFCRKHCWTPPPSPALSEKRLSTLVDVQVTWALGSIFVGIAAWAVLSYGHSWRLLALVSALPPLAVLCCFSFIEESPRWLVAKGRETKAKEVLRTMAKTNGVELVDVTIVPEEVSLCLFVGRSSGGARGVRVSV